MNFVKVASITDLPPGSMKSVKLEGKDILIANVDGSFYAMSNRCTHMFAPLSRGKLDGCIVTCPLHHAQFDVTTGKNVSDAKILFIKMKANDEPAFSVQVNGDDVLVAIS